MNIFTFFERGRDKLQAIQGRERASILYISGLYMHNSYYYVMRLDCMLLYYIENVHEYFHIFWAREGQVISNTRKGKSLRSEGLLDHDRDMCHPSMTSLLDHL